MGSDVIVMCDPVAMPQTFAAFSETIQSEGRFDNRNVSQLPSINTASYAKQIVDSIAKSICSALKWIGIVIGGVSASALSIITLTTFSSVYNLITYGRDEIFSSFMDRGGQIGLSIGQFVTGRQDRDL